MDVSHLREVLSDEAASIRFAPMDPDPLVRAARHRRRLVGAASFGIVAAAVAVTVTLSLTAADPTGDIDRIVPNQVGGCTSAPAAHAIGNPLPLGDCDGNIGLSPLPTLYVQAGQAFTISGLQPATYDEPTSANPSIVRMIAVTRTMATFRSVQGGIVTVRLRTTLCDSLERQQSGCPVMTVRVISKGEINTCPSQPAVRAPDQRQMTLVSCSGNLGLRPLPTVEVHIGEPLTLVGISPAYDNPTSSDPAVVKVADVSTSTATLRPERAGTATIRLRTAFCAVGPEQQDACGAMTVHVVPRAVVS